MNLKFFFTLIAVSFTLQALSATKMDPHTPISHCYHWLDQGSRQYLSFKYTFAKANGGELTFFTTGSTSNGSIAGPGLYCGKTPADSYSYGDRVVRVDFVDDVVLYDSISGIQYCGTKGETSKTSAECAAKTWDVKFYHGGGVGNIAWYVIQNPMAIDSWSANSDQLEQDLRLNAAINDASFQAKATQTIALMTAERSSLGKLTFTSMNARASLIDLILKDPAKLDAIPPLNVITRVLNDNSGKLTDDQKVELYGKFIRRSLRSNDTEFSEVNNLMKKSPEIEQEAIAAVNETLSDVKDVNPLVIMGIVSAYSGSFRNIGPSVYQRLVSRVLGNEDLILQLANSDMILSAELKAIGLQEIRSRLAAPLDLKNSVTSTLPSVLNKFASDRELAGLKAQWRALVFSPKVEPLGISINSDTYYLKTTDIETQCQLAITLSSDNKDVSVNFLFRKQKFDLGTTNNVNSTELCQRLSTLTDAVAKTKISGTDVPLYIVKGRIEKTPFTFIGVYNDDIKNQCGQFYSSLPTKQDIDEVFTSINGAKEVRTYNSQSYWTTKESLCGALAHAISGTVLSKAETGLRANLAAHAARNRALKNSTSGYLVEGTIRNRPFVFFGRDTDEVQTQCLSFLTIVNDTSQTDEIFWKVGTGAMKRIYNSNSYWQRHPEICEALKNGITNAVPTKASLQRDVMKAKWRTSQPKGSYKITGRFETETFEFYGVVRDDIISQCREYYDFLDQKGNIDEIYVSINGAKELRHYNSNSYWNTKGELCDAFHSAIPSVPSRAELVQLQKRNAIIQTAKDAEKLPGAISVKGKVEDLTEYHFAGKNGDAVYAQCVQFFPYIPNPTQIDDVTISVNKRPIRSLRNGSSYWSTDRLFCQMIKSEIEQK